MKNLIVSLATGIIMCTCIGCTDRGISYNLEASVENLLNEKVTIQAFEYFTNGTTITASMDVAPNEAVDIGSLFIQPMHDGGNNIEVLSKYLDMTSIHYITLTFSDMKTLSFQYDSEPRHLNPFDGYGESGWQKLESKRKRQSVRFYITNEHKALAK